MKHIISRIALFLLFLFFAFYGNAQPIDYYTAAKETGVKKYIRLLYDNDLFTGTDRYYTQGIYIEYGDPRLKHIFLSKLLLKPYANESRYGLTLQLFAFTPTSILNDQILRGDRPFDANISAELFSVQQNETKKRQLSSAIQFGVMGPLALGEEIQRGIHKLTHDPLPHGWQYQIQNDIIINYRVSIEQELLRINNNFLLTGITEARAGTLNDNVSAGLSIIAGKINKRFSSTQQHNKPEYYFFGQGRVTAVGYDASLQGGLFNRNNPYIIAAKDITRAVNRADVGIAVNFKKLSLSYTQSFLSKEFRTGKEHQWGGITAGVLF